MAYTSIGASAMSITRHGARFSVLTVSPKIEPCGADACGALTMIARAHGGLIEIAFAASRARVWTLRDSAPYESAIEAARSRMVLPATPLRSCASAQHAGTSTTAPRDHARSTSNPTATSIAFSDSGLPAIGTRIRR
jgi:hypothetical protein